LTVSIVLALKTCVEVAVAEPQVIATVEVSATAFAMLTYATPDVKFPGARLYAAPGVDVTAVLFTAATSPVPDGSTEQSSPLASAAATPLASLIVILRSDPHEPSAASAESAPSEMIEVPAYVEVVIDATPAETVTVITAYDSEPERAAFAEAATSDSFHTVSEYVPVALGTKVTFVNTVDVEIAAELSLLVAFMTKANAVCEAEPAL
jgi:hypothetical protein